MRACSVIISDQASAKRAFMTKQTSSMPAPVAPRHPHSFTTHGITVSDDYAWLKDAKWQEVLRDPVDAGAGHPHISGGRERLHREPARPYRALAEASWLRKCAGASRKTIPACPSPDGPFAYLRKFREGGQHEIVRPHAARRRRGQIVLDGDALAADHNYFKFGGARHSPDHTLQAWSADIKGSEYFSIRVRDWADGTRSPTTSSRRPTAAWSGARTARAFFYVKLDDNHRPMQVWRHRLGTSAGRRHAGLRGAGLRLVHPSCMRAPAAASA